jgi:TonB family protein
MLDIKSNSTGAYRGIRTAAESKQPRKLMLALVLLLVALAGVVIKDHQFWFGTDDSTLESDGNDAVTASATVPKLPATMPHASHSAPAFASRNSAKNSAKNAKTQVPAEKTPAAEPEAAAAPAVTRTVLPPLDVEVVAGDKHHKLHPGSNAAKVEISRPTDSAIIAAATDATDRERLSNPAAEPPASYPLLAQQMRVQGSVVLQALIGADGIIQNLHVLSGPGILSSAAQQAVREWRFKPIMQNGQAVESQAKITVNFNIKIADGSGKTTIAESRPLIIESLAR